MNRESALTRSLEALVPPPFVMTATGLLMWALSRFSPPFRLPSPMNWILPAVLAAVSIGLVAAGILALRKSATTIDPTRPSSASKLITDGVYRLTRNPMYVGFAGVLLAWGFHLQAWWSLPLPPLFCLYVTVFQILPEERALRIRFGAHYVAYSAKVRRWL